MRRVTTKQATMLSGAFGTRIFGIVRSALRDCRSFGWGYEQESMSDLYDKIKENLEFRKEWAETCGRPRKTAWGSQEGSQSTPVTMKGRPFSEMAIFFSSSSGSANTASTPLMTASTRSLHHVFE